MLIEMYAYNRVFHLHDLIHDVGCHIEPHRLIATYMYV